VISRSTTEMRPFSAAIYSGVTPPSTCRVQSSKMLGGASQTVSKTRVECNGK
jgi:hypothetical protein